jgi:hypothetical protein
MSDRFLREATPEVSIRLVEWLNLLGEEAIEHKGTAG